MLKNIIKKLKTWICKKFCKIAVDISNGIDATVEILYTDKNGSIKIYDVSYVMPPEPYKVAEKDREALKKFCAYRGWSSSAASNLITPLERIYQNDGGNKTFIQLFVSKYVLFKNSKIVNLAVNAKKYRTRKKNKKRLEKIYNKELKNFYERVLRK